MHFKFGILERSWSNLEADEAHVLCTLPVLADQISMFELQGHKVTRNSTLGS